MSTKQIVEASLMLGGATLGVVGAAMIEPVVISAGALAAGAVAIMRYNDQRHASQQGVLPSVCASSSQQK